MNEFFRKLLAPFSSRWSKTRSTLQSRSGEAGRKATDALHEFKDSDTAKRAASKLNDLRDSDTAKRAASKLSDLRDSDTGKRAAGAIQDLRQRDSVRKAEEAARRTMHDLRSGSGSSGDGASPS